MKNGIIGSVTDAARDYLDFIGFDKGLDVIINAVSPPFITVSRFELEIGTSLLVWFA